MFLYHLVGLFHELVELLAGKRRPHQGCHLANCNAISHPGIFEVALNRNNIINATHTTNNTSPQMGLMPLDNVWFCKAHRPKNTTNKDGWMWLSASTNSWTGRSVRSAPARYKNFFR